MDFEFTHDAILPFGFFKFNLFTTADLRKPLQTAVTKVLVVIHGIVKLEKVLPNVLHGVLQ